MLSAAARRKRASCKHRWFLGTPNDKSPRVAGICKHCGRRKRFIAIYDRDPRDIEMTLRKVKVAVV